MLVAGKYEIVRELGHGGMGVVYLANHVDMDRPCALKMLKAEALDAPDALSRFHREARSASRISHPNVVAVYDFGKAEDGSAYLAMEYVEGKTLDSVLRQTGPLSPRRAARIVWQMANGLTVAHDLGIVHRDLKPANIMLTRYRAWEDFVKVVDFGVAKAVRATGASAVTSTGLRVGTPAYMSPEQWLDGAVDHRSDVYTMALIALEMLSGSAPNAPSVLAGGGQQTLEAVAASGSWPADIKAVLARGLSVQPEDRQASAAEFASAFVAAVNQMEPPAPGFREPWDERLQTPVSVPVMSTSHRGRIAVAVAGVALAGLVAVLAWPRGAQAPAVGPDSTVTDGGTAGGTTGDSGLSTGGAESEKDAKSGAVVAPAESAGGRPRRNDNAVVPAPVDSLAMLRAIFDLDRPDIDSARRVVDLADALLRGVLGDSARIEVWYHLAEAQFYLDDESAACASLGEARILAARTGFLARSIQLLSSRRC
ncbi:MAG TPA: serine/threonine-protein kinase [Gemmatimonadaceae bacterium]